MLVFLPDEQGIGKTQGILRRVSRMNNIYKHVETLTRIRVAENALGEETDDPEERAEELSDVELRLCTRQRER